MPLRQVNRRIVDWLSGCIGRSFAEQDQKRLWALGTALVPGDRACITLGKVLGVNAPPAKDARHPTPGVREVTLGLQLTVQLRHVKGTSYLLELWWSADGEIGRTERWIDRKIASQTTHLAGVVGTPQLIGLLHGIGGSPLTVHARVYAR